jgi:hypothetical protein
MQEMRGLNAQAGITSTRNAPGAVQCENSLNACIENEPKKLFGKFTREVSLCLQDGQVDLADSPKPCADLMWA